MYLIYKLDMRMNFNNSQVNLPQPEKIESDYSLFPTESASQPLADRRPRPGNARKQTGKDRAFDKPARKQTLHQIQGTAPPPAGSAGATDVNSPPPNDADTTQAAVDQSVKQAGEMIDLDMKNLWSRLVIDEKKWRDENYGQLGVEDIKRHQWKAAEAYLLLTQLAQQRKDNLKEQASGFKFSLDKNGSNIAAAVEKGDSNTAKKLADERDKQFKAAIDDTKNQASSFSTLIDKVFNKIHVGAETPEIRNPRSSGDEQMQAAIDKTTAEIEMASNLVSNEEHSADFHGIPRSINPYRKNDLVLNEMASNASVLAGSLEGLAKSGGLNKTIEEKWNIPGLGKLLTPLSVAGAATDIGNFSKQVSEFAEKNRQGTATSDDKTALVASTMKITNTVLQFVPGIGEIATPFIAVANILLDTITQEKGTPVENAASQMNSQSLGDPIVAPEVTV
jgi:hypothetical protein